MIRSSHVAVLVASVVAAVTVGFGSTANTSATDALDPFLCYAVGRGAAPDAGAADLADMLGSPEIGTPGGA